MIKNNPFFTSSSKYLLKYEHFDNRWFEHSVMKTVDAESFQRRKDIKEGRNKKNNDFDRDILE